MKLFWVLISAFQFFSFSAFSAELRGTITNYANGLPMEGVLVEIPALNLQAMSGLNGEYSLRDLPVGTYVVKFSRGQFAPFAYEQAIDDAARAYGRNVELKPLTGNETSEEFLREEPKYRLDEVTVLTTRAGRDHPVTYTNVSQRDIQNQNYGQDTPLLLSELPNVSTYSEGGAGVGYSYLRMRGFGQDRVAVQVNGVPLNDAETHEVFWIDLPDFAEDLADMQVQRGVGSSLYGPAAFGGSINLVTRTPGLGDRALIRAEGTYGTWNTRRAMVQFQSGRIHNRYGVTGRLTRIHTDGYRFGSWADLWSYYLAGARFTPKHTTRILFYGGPEKTHLAYEGIPVDSLNDERSRRFNEFQYPGEIDNFFQPHYELHDEWALGERVTLTNSLYLFKGDGYYDQYRAGQSPVEYFPHQDLFPGVDINVLRRRNVNETDGGWIPRASIEHKYGTTVVGGDIRLHDARHEGILLWSDQLVASSPDHHYYDYQIEKTSVSGYVHNLFEVTDRLHALADLQIVSHRIEMKEDTVWNVHYKKTYSSVNPRAGLRYVLLQGPPSASLYGSLSFAQREPKPRDIYDPQDYWQTPAQGVGHFEQDASGLQYVGPSLKPEKLTDIELGTEWAWKRATLGANVYYITLRDAQVPYGGLDNLGLLVTINAEETLHQGIEFVAGLTPLDGLKFTGNLALTDHHFVSHSEVVWNSDTEAYETFVRDGNRIGFDPEYVANARIEYSYRGAMTGLGFRGVGKQYVDNSQNDDTAVPAYALMSFDLGYRFTGIPGLSAADIKLRVNNLLDTEFEAFGYNYYYPAYPLYIVGAPRAMYVTLGVEL